MRAPIFPVPPVEYKAPRIANRTPILSLQPSLQSSLQPFLQPSLQQPPPPAFELPPRPSHEQKSLSEPRTLVPSRRKCLAGFYHGLLLTHTRWEVGRKPTISNLRCTGFDEGRTKIALYIEEARVRWVRTVGGSICRVARYVCERWGHEVCLQSGGGGFHLAVATPALEEGGTA
jgi:hypothetical protein